MGKKETTAYVELITKILKEIGEASEINHLGKRKYKIKKIREKINCIQEMHPLIDITLDVELFNHLLDSIDKKEITNE